MSWAQIAKTGLPKTRPEQNTEQTEQATKQPADQTACNSQSTGPVDTSSTTQTQPQPRSPRHQKQASKSSYSSSINIPQLESTTPYLSIRIGKIDIVSEGPPTADQLPISIPPDPAYWKRLHDKRRHRKEHSDEAEDAGTSVADAVEAHAKPKPSSWASLLRPGGLASGDSTWSGAVTSSLNGTSQHQKYESLVDALQNLRVKFSSPLVQPRGLVNSGNMCFMNVVLQALLYCAPFFNMLLDIRQNVAFSFNQPTPLLEALIQFTNEFKQDPTPMALLLEEEDTDPFVPENVYEALRQKNVFQTLRGQQEDAQEFMSYLIDGISQEMADILQQHQHQHRSSNHQTDNASNVDDESEWQEVGPHNKASIVRDSSDSFVATPITRIFGGSIRSTLAVPHSASAASMRGRHSGKARPSSNREPFQWLALDISSDSVRSIEQALDEFVAPETIEGYTNIYGESVNATKQILLEKVPPVLVLHLKRFVFCHNEGVQKVHKFIQYPQELQLSPDWLAKSKASSEHRNARYRLESVIYHHGSQASGGHYTCDLRRSEKEWLRFDDIDITILDSVDKVLDEKMDRSAYILFYTISS